MDISFRRKKRKAEVNIVPMVDVLTVLIFFFLLTMQFKEIYAVDITPPQMKSSDQVLKDKPSVIAVSKDGAYYLGRDKLSKEELEAKINELAKNNPEVSIVLMADENTPLNYVTSAIDMIKLAKIKKLSLQTSKLK